MPRGKSAIHRIHNGSACRKMCSPPNGCPAGQAQRVLWAPPLTPSGLPHPGNRAPSGRALRMPRRSICFPFASLGVLGNECKRMPCALAAAKQYPLRIRCAGDAGTGRNGALPPCRRASYGAKELLRGAQAVFPFFDTLIDCADDLLKVQIRFVPPQAKVRSLLLTSLFRKRNIWA